MSFFFFWGNIKSFLSTIINCKLLSFFKIVQKACFSLILSIFFIKDFLFDESFITE